MIREGIGYCVEMRETGETDSSTPNDSVQGVGTRCRSFGDAVVWRRVPQNCNRERPSELDGKYLKYVTVGGGRDRRRARHEDEGCQVHLHLPNWTTEPYALVHSCAPRSTLRQCRRQEQHGGPARSSG